MRAFPARRHSLRRPLARAFGLAPRQIRLASAFRSASAILALQNAAFDHREGDGVSGEGVFREASAERRRPTVAFRAEHAFRTVKGVLLLLNVGFSFLQSGSGRSRAASAGPS